MTRILLSVAALAATLSAPALAETAQSFKFTRDGISYVAKVRDTGRVQFISGHEVASGRSFDLRVANGRVSGNYAGSPVSYTTDATIAPMQTAAR